MADLTSQEECVWTWHTFDPGDEDIQVWWDASCTTKRPYKTGDFCPHCGKKIKEVPGEGEQPRSQKKL
jgi:hypothetical protein